MTVTVRLAGVTGRARIEIVTRLLRAGEHWVLAAESAGSGAAIRELVLPSEVGGHADTGLPSLAAAALIVSSISGGTEIDSFRTVMPPL